MRPEEGNDLETSRNKFRQNLIAACNSRLCDELWCPILGHLFPDIFNMLAAHIFPWAEGQVAMGRDISVGRLRAWKGSVTFEKRTHALDRCSQSNDWQTATSSLCLTDRMQPAKSNSMHGLHPSPRSTRSESRIVEPQGNEPVPSRRCPSAGNLERVGRKEGAILERPSAPRAVSLFAILQDDAAACMAGER